MSEPALHLVGDQLVDEQGEVHRCPHCQRLEDEIEGLQRDIRGWAHRYRELKRDKEAEAKKSPHWPEAVEHFKEWKALSGRKAQWTIDRFELVEPFLKNAKYRDWISCAIAGHCFDPFVTTRKNGTENVHNGWDLLFRDAAHFEEACRKSPLEARPAQAEGQADASDSSTSDEAPKSEVPDPQLTL